MMPLRFPPLEAWLFLTRLGEAQILLPASLLAVWVLLHDAEGRRLALWWLGLLATAVLLTTATKVAFIGWGLGLPQIDFTGISGHAMFAAAVYPLLFATLAPPRAGPQLAALLSGALLAGLVGWSRCVLNAHSASEVWAGLALGGAVGLLALLRAGLAQGRLKLRLWAPAMAAAWLGLVPMLAPASQSHEFVTKVALKLAGHQQPYQREHWLRSWRAQQPVL